MPTNDGCDLLELVPGVSGMEAAWVAVIVSGVTVVVHFFGVMRVSVVQTRIAHDQQVGDRRIDTYLELLKWADSAWGNLGEDQGILAAWEAIRLPQQFVDQTHAFASDEVNQHVAQFQAAWLELKHAMGEREVAIRQAFAEGVKTRDFSSLNKLVPEYKRATSAKDRVRSSVRGQLTPKKSVFFLK